MLDQQAPHRERDPVALVGGDALAPERLGHDAEHRAAVEPLAAAFERVAAEAADLEGASSSVIVRPPERSRPAARWASRCAGGASASARARLSIAARSWSVRAPSSRASSSSRARSSAVTSASPPARWRASLAKPKVGEAVEPAGAECRGTSRRASRTVQSRGPSSARSRARRSSAVTKFQSNRALWATKTRPASAATTWSATSAKVGASPHHVVGDAGDGADRGRDRPPRVHQRIEHHLAPARRRPRPPRSR